MGGTAPAAGVFAQRASFDEVQDVAIGCVLRAFGEFGPFRSREFLLEAVEYSVEHCDLPCVQRLLCEALPKARFVQHSGERVLRAIDCAAQAREEPFLPQRDIKSPFLSALKGC